jgi:hypothetical protein
MKSTPTTSAFPVQSRHCKSCRSTYFVCKPGLIRPDLFGTDDYGEMGSCLSCFRQGAAQHALPLDFLEATRASTYQIHLCHGAAAG